VYRAKRQSRRETGRFGTALTELQRHKVLHWRDALTTR
jgi:hypothetical protein